MNDGIQPGLIALGAPVTLAAHSTKGPDPERQPDTYEHLHHNTAPGSSSSQSVDHDTLAGDNDTSSPARGIATSKRSAHSSMDHITELGDRRVSVTQGKSEFAALERRFSNLSQHSAELQRSDTRRSGYNEASKITLAASRANVADPEKGRIEEEEFDLATVLRSGREKSDESGIKHKSVGVVWEDLEVIGAGGMKINIRNFTSAIIEQFLMPTLSVLGLFGYKPFAPKPKTILYKNSGLLKPGEMCLVLGRPGSGCSTFLKSIANQRDSFMAVNGDVEYAGVHSKEMAKLYGG